MNSKSTFFEVSFLFTYNIKNIVMLSKSTFRLQPIRTDLESFALKLDALIRNMCIYQIYST
ncbi:hypothetical protein CLAVI_000885 [Candidatus Clavichlamydia salmonicola]|nr:hypothetical protein [Candidatus Clavichlamydia salmonicola]